MGAWLVVLAALLAFSGLLGSAPPPAAAAVDSLDLKQTSSSPADTFIFYGRGWGHAVGMSQWGAWRAAREGRTFAQILAFYYPGTSLEPVADTELLVKLSSEPWRDVASITQDFAALTLAPAGAAGTLAWSVGGAERQRPLAAGEQVTVTRAGAELGLSADPGQPAAWVELRPGDGGRAEVTFTAGGAALSPRQYWGRLRAEPAPAGGRLNAFNLVGLEPYLRSIAEVDYDWAQPEQPAYAPEAVKAQAVAARTYALSHQEPYLDDNQYDQVYRGYTFERQYPGLGAAAEATAGLVLLYEGRPAETYFSASSGGYTATWNDAGPPYLVAQPDPYSLAAPLENPGWTWSFSIPAADLSQKVDGLKNTEGREVHLGAISRVEVASRDTEDLGSHARTLRLTGSGGTAVVPASAFRGRFGYGSMRSTLITLIDQPGFTDVAPGSLYEDEIERVAALGLMSGYADGSFGPLQPVSRWQFAKMAVLLHNQLFPEDLIALVDVPQSPFWDVAARPGIRGDESDWVAAARQAGLVVGTSATRFAPYTDVTRDQLASMIVRAMGWEEEAAAQPPDAPGFADVPASNPHAQAAAYLLGRGILRGYPDPDGTGAVLLRPPEPTKRAHAALILCRLVDRPE